MSGPNYEPADKAVSSMLNTVLETPHQLRGPRPPSAKEIREAENAEALGGMKNPAAAVRKLPGLSSLGVHLRYVLEGFIDKHPELLSVLD